MMKKKLQLNRITKLGGLLFLMMFGLMNAQNRSLNKTESENVQQISQPSTLDIKAEPIANTEQGNPLEMMKGKAEDVSKRTVDSKHFKNGDGSMTAILGAGPIHYLKNGIYEDINTKIVAQTDPLYSFANKTNLMESHFAANSKDGIISRTKEGEVQEFLEAKMYWERNNQKIGEIIGANVQAKVSGDKLYYNNIFGNISAEFTIKSGQRKLNYIVPDKKSLGNLPLNADYLVFSEKLKLPDNLKIINGYKKYNKLKKTSEVIPGIFVIDDKENVIYEYTASTILEDYNPNEMGLPTQISPEISFEKHENIVSIFVKVNAKWITDEARKFPIAIDPTGTAYPFTATFSSGQTYSTSGAGGDIAVGYSGGWYRGWATFDLTSLPSLSSVTGATMSLYIGNKGGTMGTTGTTNVNIGHTSFDLSRLVWLNNYGAIYNAITAANNGMGAYNYMPNQNVGTWANVNLKPGASTVILEEIEKKSGNDIAFFPVSFSPSWGSGTTTRFYVIAGFNSVNRPYLTITYNEVDKYKHAAYRYANAGGIGDVGYVQIGNVSLGSINNTTAITNYAANAATIYRNTPTGYNKYNLSTNVNTGSSYTLNTTYRDLAPGVNYNSGKIATWVDWNEDGDFADANEYIGVSANSTSGNQIMSFSIDVPLGVSAGIKRLRVRSFLSDDIVSSSNYDTTYEYGETEDYNLVVNPTLQVTEAYSGASYANGLHHINYNSSVTATAGSRPGYLCTGWVGTGNVPTTGITDTATFTITQQSTITWQWENLGCSVTTTWNGTSWNNAEPNSLNTKIIFTGNYNSSLNPNNIGNLVGCSIEVNNNADVIIASNHNVEIDNEIKIETGSSFTLKSDANLIQNNHIDIVNEGIIKVERASKMKRLDYIYWGSPVAGQSFINFSPNTVASRFYRYNEEFDSFHSISNLNDSMIAGEGYAIRAPNNQNATTPNTWTGIFVGQPNNGEITFPVTKHPDSPIDPNNSSSEIISRGKNMLSNPYPSNLDLEALTNGNLTTANGVYYFWTNTNDFVDNTQVPGNGQYGNYGSNHYATYSSSGAVPAANEVNGQLPTRYIRPGQGFLFEAKINGTVTFNNNMRSADPNSNFISNRETENSPERFWLKLTTPINNSNTLLIAYIPGATNLFEPRYDAKFPQKSSDRFYSIIDDKELIIQGRQYPFSKTDLVTLGIAHFAAGNYKIEISDREGIFSNGQKIYLKDKQTGVITNLSQGSYSYTAEAGENNTRFEIIYEPETVLIANESVKGECIIYRDASDFVVKSKDKTIENIELYDASGRLVLKMKGNNSKELRFNAEKLHQGMYIVKVITKVGVITKKIINY